MICGRKVTTAEMAYSDSNIYYFKFIGQGTKPNYNFQKSDASVLITKPIDLGNVGVNDLQKINGSLSIIYLHSNQIIHYTRCY